jgi:hypothetical protein
MLDSTSEGYDFFGGNKRAKLNKEVHSCALDVNPNQGNQLSNDRTI